MRLPPEMHHGPRQGPRARLRRAAVRTALLLLVVGAAGAARGQSGAYRFDRITREDGLSNGYVFDLLQDRLGFLWIATADGLNRYDGYGFTVYRRAAFDSTALPSSYVGALYEDRRGALWVGSEGALARYDPDRDAFTRYALPAGPRGESGHAVFAITEDAQGRIWAGSINSGLYRVDPATGAVARFGHRPGVAASLGDDRVFALHADAQGALWVGTAAGLDRFDPATGRATPFLRAAEPGPTDRVWKILADARRPPLLWLATDGGLVHFDPRTGRSRRHSVTPPGETTPQAVLDLAYDPAAPNVLWAATPDGLVRFRTDDASFDVYRHDPLDPHTLTSDYLGALLADRIGMMWVGARAAGGLNRFDPGTSAFGNRLPPGYAGTAFTESAVVDTSGALWVGGDGVHRVDPRTGEVTSYRPASGDPGSLVSGDINAMLVDRRGDLWVGTDGGLDRFDARRGAFAHVPVGEDGLSDPVVGVLFESRDGALWVGTANGLNRLDPANGRIAQYLSTTEGPTTLLGHNVHTIIEGRDRALWVGTEKGLNRLDPATGAVTRYGTDPADPASLAGEEVWVLFEDPAGGIWVGTRDDGVSRLDPATGRFTRYTYDPRRPDGLSSDYVNAVHVRRSEPDVAWVGTEGGGLDRIDLRTGRVRHFDAQVGFPTLVFGILEDATGHLWLSTNEGLVHFDPATGAFRRYGHESGALSQYWYASHAQRPDGTLLFWSAEGVIAFDPAEIRESAAPPAVVLTGLRVGNEPVRPGAGGPLSRPLWAETEVRLAHDQDLVTFEFVGLHFKDPARNRYRYRLEGYDPEWVEAGTQRSATYTNLPPGRYTFRVRAASADGVWNEEGAAVRVVVAPPWWRSWWAYGLYAVLLAGAAAGALRWDRARSLRREREAARERELAQARALEAAYRELDTSHRELRAAQDQLVHQEKMASLGRLTAGVAHEIKNPLNFVNNFAGLSAELLAELRHALAARGADADDEVAALLDDLGDNVARIEEHGRRADGIVRSMLGHSRTGVVTRQSVDVNAVVEEYASLAYHGLRATDPAFQARLALDLDPAAGRVEAITQDLGRVVLNLVNNGLYAANQAAARRDGTAAEPVVRVATRDLGDAVEVRVEDNGPGIPAGARARIFEPFFTTKPSGEGTGLGLSITYDIVTAGHGGQIAVESEEGVGTTFVVRLPRAGAAEGQSDGAERAARAADGTSSVASTSTPAPRSAR